MALDGLLQAMAADGDVEARQLIDEARARADSIRAAADARAERRCAEALASRDASLQSEFDALRAGAVREAREQVLRAREEFLEQVFTAVSHALPGVLDDASSAGALEALCREAIACFPGVAVRIRCRPGLAAALLAGPDSSGTTEVVADEGVPEGVIVESADGAARVDNTLGARMARRRPLLSIALVRAAAAGSAA